MLTMQADDDMDARFGYEKVLGGPERTGWLLNMQPVWSDSDMRMNERFTCC